MNIKKIIIIGSLLLSGFVQTVFAKVENYSGSLRLKYEYQHLVINDISIFVDRKQNKTENNTLVNDSINKDFGFCFSEDLDETVIDDKKQKFKNQDTVLENFENTKEDKDDTNIEKKIEKTEIQIINKEKIKHYVVENVVPFLNQEQNNVTISRDKEQKIIFDGYGQQGISVNVDTTVELIAMAIENNISYVNIDVSKQEPEVIVTDEELKKLGIKELVSVGRSDFRGSSWKRVKNVTNGASKFNGYLIPNNYIFSFNEQLGDIDASTGYVPELVILGAKVVPEYGGGLCQVSSTAYRGAMLSGMEIVERHNHSYAVSYYAPHGSDATIYSPIKDFKFKNTSGNALLLQTRRGGHNNNELFFHFYGTKPLNRDVQIFGPFKSNFRGALASKTTYDPSLPAGTATVVSHSVPGVTSQFYRSVKENNKILYRDIFKSIYQARGYWVIRGGEDPELLAKQEKDTKKEELISPSE